MDKRVYNMPFFLVVKPLPYQAPKDWREYFNKNYPVGTVLQLKYLREGTYTMHFFDLNKELIEKCFKELPDAN